MKLSFQTKTTRIHPEFSQTKQLLGIPFNKWHLPFSEPGFSAVQLASANMFILSPKGFNENAGILPHHPSIEISGLHRCTSQYFGYQASLWETPMDHIQYTSIYHEIIEVSDRGWPKDLQFESRWVHGGFKPETSAFW